MAVSTSNVVHPFVIDSVTRQREPLELCTKRTFTFRTEIDGYKGVVRSPNLPPTWTRTWTLAPARHVASMKAKRSPRNAVSPTRLPNTVTPAKKGRWEHEEEEEGHQLPKRCDDTSNTSKTAQRRRDRAQLRIATGYVDIDFGSRRLRLVHANARCSRPDRLPAQPKWPPNPEIPPRQLCKTLLRLSLCNCDSARLCGVSSQNAVSPAEINMSTVSSCVE
ncbi:hypothetical protein BDZ97DRAFT_1752488 [Flammula alnicola]|nr:hypothetical protein BDZ97DRAFT_1752488 [Flammula alnicola]